MSTECIKKIRLNLDKSKKNILYIDSGDLNQYSYMNGVGRTVYKKLEEQFNIIHLNTNPRNDVKNLYTIDVEMQEVLDRKKDNPNYVKDNYKKILDSFERMFKDIDELEYIIIGNIGYFVINQQTYVSKTENLDLHNRKNEFFDYLGSDKNYLEIIDKTNTELMNTFDKRFSPYAISTRKIFYHFEIIKFLSKRLKNNVICFITDPATYTPYFVHHNIPTEFYYFANDNRGTREFKKFDIAQIQHLVYDLKFNDSLDDWGEPTKDKNFIFIGTLFYMKGNRSSKFNQFFKDLNDDKSELFIPLKINGVIKNDGNQKDSDKVKETFPQLFDDLTSHACYKGHIKPSEINSYVKRFKYSLILACISTEDSLNFRVVRDVYHGVLPFLDKDYDPAFLQIPEDIQERLVVKDGHDIDEKIKYFNNNDSERIELLNELKELFKIDKYINEPDKMINEQIRAIIP